VVTIPTSREFTSLNLSHAVMILCYEIFIASSAATTGAQATPKLARSEELEGMYGQIKTLLADIEFINPENPDYWMMHLRRFFAARAFIPRGRDYSRFAVNLRGMLTTNF
jgi:tRNA/rRNA methyltransferase